MDTGFITLHRKITENPIWKNSQLSHLFLTLLLLANHEENKVLFNGKIEVVGRGQLITGRFALSKMTGIKPGTIHSYIATLVAMGIINTKPSNKFTIITIVKYDEYQSVKNKASTKPSNKVAPKEQQGSTNNNDNNVNNDNKLEGQAPSHIAYEFFNNEQKRREIGIKVAVKYQAPITVIAEEIRKFTAYWKEKNKSGTKEKWQLQQTFEVGLRLENWLNKTRQFNKPDKPKRKIWNSPPTQ